MRGDWAKSEDRKSTSIYVRCGPCLSPREYPRGTDALITMKLCLSSLATIAVVQGFAGQQPKKLLLLRDSSTGAYESGGNAATALPGATNLSTGAATTFESFSTALNACRGASCDVFFNFHTNYSFGYNAGAAC